MGKTIAFSAAEFPDRDPRWRCIPYAVRMAAVAAALTVTAPRVAVPAGPAPRELMLLLCTLEVVAHSLASACKAK